MVPLGDPQGNEASGSGAPASSGAWSGVYRWKTCDLHTLRSAGLPPGVPRGRQQTRQKDSAVGSHGHRESRWPPRPEHSPCLSPMALEAGGGDSPGLAQPPPPTALPPSRHPLSQEGRCLPGRQLLV